MLFNVLAILAAASAVTAQCGPSSSSSAPSSVSSAPPVASGVAIHPNGNAGKCMDVRGANFANGTPVQIYDCNGTPAQKWNFKRGTGALQVAGTNFCLDAGSCERVEWRTLTPAPGNGIGLKIWQCYAGLNQQTWTYGSDNKLSLAGGQVVDLTNGNTANGNQLQTWQGFPGNTNQVGGGE